MITNERERVGEQDKGKDNKSINQSATLKSRNGKEDDKEDAKENG